MFSNSKNILSSQDRSIFILLFKKDGRKKEFSGLEKDCTVSAGTLVEFLDSEDSCSYTGHPLSSSINFRFRTIDTSDVYLISSMEDVEHLEVGIFQLLLPIQSLKDRLLVFRDKHLLNYGNLLKVGDAVFVRVKDLQSNADVEGIVRYRGHIDETGGTYFGVALKEKRGLSDGSHNGRKYFECPPDCAVFVPLNRIRRNRADWQKNDLMRAGEIQALDSSQLNVQLGEKKSESIQSMTEYADLKLGERVVWPSDYGDESGTVRWIGYLPDETKDNITIGVEFDNPVGTGTGKYKDRRLFYTKQAHASLIPPIGLMKESERSPRDLIFSEQAKLLSDWQRNKSLNQQGYQNQAQTSNINNRSSLPAQFNHHTGFLEPVMGEVNGASSQPPTYDQVYPQGRSSQSSSNGLNPDPGLTIGCMVEVRAKPPLYGIIRWIGITENTSNRLIAGVELEQDNSIGTDGVFKNVRLFTCKPGRALFVPLKNCLRDRRYRNSPEMTTGVGGIESPDVPGDIPIPDVLTDNDLQLICGKNKGIQGHHNSCYLDSTLFSMFYFANVFDSIFNRPPKPDDLPEYTLVQKVLKEGIVNPLRKHNYVASNNVWKLRTLLDKLGTVEGMLGEEKDVEEFLSALLSQIMKADPLLHLSTGEDAYFYQLFMEKDEKLLLPSTQNLVELSFLQGNVKLKQVPACLMIQMPRFGKDYKMFRRIVPSLQLDITDILENAPRDCIVCGDLATWECKNCYQVHGLGLNATAFCDKCKSKSHQHSSRKDHRPDVIPKGHYFSYLQTQKEENKDKANEDTVSLPKEKMELFAVICIQTSHYVSFVKCGPGLDAPWVFFDSMADRIGEKGGYNVPKVTHVPQMKSWLSETNLNNLNDDEDKDLPEHLRRLLCDGYMCMYQSLDVMMFQ